MFGFCVLTTSDRCADGKMDDISGELAVELLSNYGFLLIEKQIVPDDFHKITSTLEKWTLRDEINFIVTTGGTGLSDRDVTPQATLSVIEYQVTGIVDYVRLKSAEKEIYIDEENVRSSWTPSTLRDELKGVNWNIIRWQVKEYSIPTMIRIEQIEQWLPSHPDSPNSSYGQRLSAYFSPEQLNYLRETFRNEVAGTVVDWHSVSLFMQLNQN